MFKKVLKYSAITAATLILALYFFLAEGLYNIGSKEEVCKNIRVVILDSLKNRFVDEEVVANILNRNFADLDKKRIDDINLYDVEELLEGRSAIHFAEASINRDGTLNIEITQRRPVLRINTIKGGFYIDETQYLFPLFDTYTSYVPVVSGHIPLTLEKKHRGNVGEKNSKWLASILELGLFLERNPFWNAQIQQISIEKNGDIFLIPRIGDHKIIFGDLKDIDLKFSKLSAFYQNVIPIDGWSRYSEINLKFNNQIVCKVNN